MLNQPIQSSNNLQQAICQAINTPVQGNYEAMVRTALSKNPALAQKFQQAMMLYQGVENPWIILNEMLKANGINPAAIPLPRR